jgi:hypothetical protein
MKISALLLALVPGAISAQSLRPPQDAKLILRLQAQGDQIYTCTQNAYTFAWQLKAPDARLLDDSNHVVGRHFAGPTWQLTDGSQVVGRPTAKFDATEPNAVPWLELAVVNQTGHGRLEGVRVIQRRDTHGGQPPAGGCDEAHVNREARIPYTAVYEFYS